MDLTPSPIGPVKIMIGLILILFVLLAQAASAVDYTLPPANAGDWTPGTAVGVVGGIDQYLPGGANARTNLIDVTQAPYNADNTGVSDAASAINTAIADSSANDVIYLPAGTYLTNSTINFSRFYGDRTIRGDGPGVTIIDNRGGSQAIRVGEAGGPWSAGDFSRVEPITAGFAKGVTTITLANTTNYDPGNLMKIRALSSIDNADLIAGATIVADVFGAAKYAHIPTFVIVSKTASTVTFKPPLPMDYTGLSPDAFLQQSLYSYHTENVGVEDLSITQANASILYGINLSRSTGCWVYNCDVSETNNYPIYADSAVNAEIRKNTVGPGRSGGSNGAGILWNSSSASLITDNIIKGVGPLIQENASSIYNAWCFNLMWELISNGALLNHGPHNAMNIYEGNIMPNWKSDGYFGSCSHNTIYRNWITCTTAPDETTLGVENFGGAANRWTRNFVETGNVYGVDGTANGLQSYGNPYIGNGNAYGFAGPTGSSDQAGEIDYAQPGYGVPGTGGSVNTYVIQESDIFVGDFWEEWKRTGVVTSRISDTSAIVTMDSSADGYFVGQGDGNNGPGFTWNSWDNYRVKMEISAISGLDITFVASGYDEGSVMPAVSTPVVVWAGSEGFNERDLDVQASFTVENNYIASSSGTGAVANPTADTLPDSFIYSAQPSWWTDDGFAGTWPPVDPDSPTFNLGIIPAGARYLAGENVAVAPSFSPPGGTYGSAQDVTLSTSSPSSTIYYTLDGSDPDNTDAVYSAPINIAATTTIKAFTVATGLDDSSVTSATYTIGAAPTGGTATATSATAGTINVGG